VTPARASLLYWPCFQAPLALPLGAPLRAPWNRHTIQARTAGARQPVVVEPKSCAKKRAAASLLRAGTMLWLSAVVMALLLRLRPQWPHCLNG
jgi:hypothetical protein